MAKWLAGQTAVLTARVRAPHECRFSVLCQVIALPGYYDAITVPTEFISIVNTEKLLCPRYDYPFLRMEKISVYYYYYYCNYELVLFFNCNIFKQTLYQRIQINKCIHAAELT